MNVPPLLRPSTNRTRRTLSRTVLGTLTAASLAAGTLLAAAGSAAADPVTVTGSGEYADTNVRISDDNPAVGDTLELTYTLKGKRSGLITTPLTLKASPGTFGTLLSAPTCTNTRPEYGDNLCPLTDDDRFPVTDQQQTILITPKPSINEGSTTVFTIAFKVLDAADTKSFDLTALDNDAFGKAGPTKITVGATQPKEADLAVGLSARSGLLRSAVDYTLNLTNNGPGAVESGTASVQLSKAISDVSGLTDGCTFDKATHRVTCPTGTLAKGASAERKFRGHVKTLTLRLPLKAQATATSTPADPNPANNTASANCAVVTGLIILC
ncbi:hypothetical protein ACIBEA_44285 [Streptomyces sp. NPDC051555]|uniref:hypothetical protein n=1 Tax=Streptomyces sp. NPDC051555 TaxID=3365657 RepID=UPI00378FAEA7